MTKKKINAALILFLLLPILACCASKDDKKGKEETPATAHAQVKHHAKAKKAEMPGIENFSRIAGSEGFGGATPGFGGATKPSAMAELKKNGFASVICLRLATEPGAEIDASRAAAKAAGLKYIHLPFDAKRPDPDLVGNFLADVSNKANEPVYIHCHSASRAAALWMIGRVFEDGWSHDEAAKEATAIAEKPSEAVAFATAYIASHEPSRHWITVPKKEES